MIRFGHDYDPTCMLMDEARISQVVLLALRGGKAFHNPVFTRILAIAGAGASGSCGEDKKLRSHLRSRHHGGAIATVCFFSRATFRRSPELDGTLRSAPISTRCTSSTIRARSCSSSATRCVRRDRPFSLVCALSSLRDRREDDGQVPSMPSYQYASSDTARLIGTPSSSLGGPSAAHHD